MTYRVWSGGKPMTTPPPAPLAGPTTVPAEGPVTDGPDYRYSTTWNWAVPSTGTGFADYYIKADIKCVRPRPTLVADRGRTLAQANVLAASTQNNPGFFTSILRFFGDLLGLSRSAPQLVPLGAAPLTDTPVPAGPTPTDIILPPAPTKFFQELRFLLFFFFFFNISPTPSRTREE